MLKHRPADVVALDRTEYYAAGQPEIVEGSGEWKAEWEYAFAADGRQLLSWAAGNMDWSDVSSVARRVIGVARADSVDYQDGWVNGPKRIVEVSDDARRGNWFQTFTGVRFWPYDPRPEEINAVDIAHGLALQCRFNGHVREFYSVAQHCVIVSCVVPPAYALWGLLHDAAEAYLGDMIRPLKLGMPQYREVEDLVMRAVAQRFGLSWPEPPEVKSADTRVLYTERRDLLTVQREWSQKIVPLAEPICTVPWETAEQLFTKRLEMLTR